MQSNKSNHEKGSLYLIPCPIVEWEMDTIAPRTLTELYKLDFFVVERLRTARRFIAKTDHPKAIDELTFFEYDKHDPMNGLEQFLEHLNQGKSIGLISEAGYPGIADPGKNVVAYAHRHACKVIPLIGPSSILLALVSSGFNGQSFVFHGYLSNKKNELSGELKKLHTTLGKTGQTQIFMDAPYRNQFLIEGCIQALPGNQLLCVACDINAETEYIRTMPLSQWKKEDLAQFHKRPAIFLLGS